MHTLPQYLPPDWILGPNINTITIRELLTHKAGIRDTNEVYYSNLKMYIASGVSLSDKGVYVYNNSNFALLRMIIPILNGQISTSGNPELAWENARQGRRRWGRFGAGAHLRRAP